MNDSISVDLGVHHSGAIGNKELAVTKKEVGSFENHL